MTSMSNHLEVGKVFNLPPSPHGFIFVATEELLRPIP